MSDDSLKKVLLKLDAKDIKKLSCLSNQWPEPGKYTRKLSQTNKIRTYKSIKTN